MIAQNSWPACTSPWTWLQLPAISIGAEVDAVGEKNYQDALEAVAGGRNAFGTKTRILTVMLVREPGNAYDANAVRVEAAGATLGYLSREDAPRFHVLLDRLATTGIRGTCRAILTGGWDHGHGDRGLIGIKVLTGRKPARWNGRAGFLPAAPWQEHQRVALDSAGPGISELAARPLVSLVDAGRGDVTVSATGSIVGQISGRPDLAAFVSRVTAAGSPSTTQARVTEGHLTILITDPDAVIAALNRLGPADLYNIRRGIQPTGRWICQRCHRIWSDPRRPPNRWYDIEDEDCDSPHICPGCWTYKFTHPL